MKYVVKDSRIIVSMLRGDSLMDCLLEVVKEQKITAGTFTGIGAVENIILGGYDPYKKVYNKKEFTSPHELASCMGNIAYIDGEPFVHCHAVLSDHDFHAFAGHIFEAKVAAVGEFVITPIDMEINRKQSEEIGLAIWDL